ncbi:hypothetical protein P171DRAFT_525255 [Karstenula rhodostoma CBS 690.94]|uniref:Uncharacterized protein n=1 Tax=Karstenula rhodostoma CBS 690.94 TaxID=1392251 RepID=A0A9P4P6M2_9PLEO|nr:hypothetical protein P171DRAFT_525255 [Karstenula rhodostoma CBS 690.94]
MASSDDLAEQQLFAEIQASARKVRQQAHEPPSSSAIQSANLLNAARLNSHRTVAAAPSSSPSHTSYDLGQSGPAGANGMARAGGAGKLKPVDFLREDLAKQPRRELARRGDPYELGFSSPEKMAANPPAKPRQKPRKKSKEVVQHPVPPNFEAPAPSISPGTEETRKDVPPASPPVSVTDENHVEEAPETPPGTSKRLPSKSISRIDSSREPGQQPHPMKRKAGAQSSKTGRPSKSPRKGAAEDDTGSTSHAKSRSGPQQAKGTHPQVVIPSTDPPSRNNRARKAKHAEPNPPPTEPAQVRTNERRTNNKERTTTQAQQEARTDVNDQREHEHQDEPPQSAQKPPEQDPKLPKPQTSKRRKIKQLKPAKTMTGLDIPSDNEVYTTESTRPTKKAQQEPPPAESEQRQRRKGKKPTSDSAHEPAAVSVQEQETQPREPTPRPREGNLPQALMSSRNAEIASNQNMGNAEIAARTKQTRSKRKTRTTEPVSVPATHSGRSQHGTSQHDRPQSHHRDARNNLPNELDMDEDEDPDRIPSEVDESGQSGKEDELNDEDDELNGEDDEDDEDDEDVEDGEDSDHDHSADIDMVFEFLDSAEHSGECQTEDAMAVKEACQKALEVLDDPESTLREVSITTKHMQVILSKYGVGSDEKKRKSLKVDAYAYMFRQVASYLKSLYGWLAQRYRVFESSLDAMRIITPLFSAIVSTKDRVAGWNIKIPSRYKGVRLIKDVESNLIAPLRRLSEAYLTALRNLKDEARKKRAYEELAQKRREREQDEMEALRIDKLNGWIELHVCRLRVEPDARRRQALFMRQEYFDKKVAKWTDEETEGREERDANGVLFSRVDLFKKRVIPPASSPSADVEKEWTDEQMEALIYGLQNFAGPCVFEKIFEHYCGVGQPLRRFGVPEITAKAWDVRMRLLKTYEEREWKEVPSWIQKIPILP